jgi:hypothetical protein
MRRSAGDRAWIIDARRLPTASPDHHIVTGESRRRVSFPQKIVRYWRQLTIVFVLAIAIIGGGTTLWRAIPGAQAACPTYTIRAGDTLGHIAATYRTTIATLASLNHIPNVNRIYVGQRICVAYGAAAPSDPLEWSTQAEVHTLLLQAADRHGLPRNLVISIAWQESNWTQHVIAWDGGVGTMQLMPYTTQWLNNDMHTRYNPYRLYDNIELGTSYLRMLWNQFPNSLDRIISAYNEGAHNVVTRGIFNWHYVYNVEWDMKHLR